MASHGSSSSANEAAHTVLGILGNIASCLFFISSLPTIVSMVKCKSSGGLSGDLYLLKLFNCMLWCLYGLPFVHPHDLWVVLTNSFGCAFALLYILTYFLYATTKAKKKAVQLRDSAFLHPSASIAGFIKGAIWSAYGIVSFDIFILIPNGVGVLIGIIQTVLVLVFIRGRTPNICNIHDCEYGHQAPAKPSMEMQTTDHTKTQTDQESVDNTSRRSSLSFSNIARMPSFLGIPRQGSITSSVVIPVTSDDH